MHNDANYQVTLTKAGGEYPHVPNLCAEGGLKLDIESNSNFLSATKSVVMDLGSKALKGSLDFSNIILPPSMLSEYTRLETISFEYPSICKYLSEAAKHRDPVERMKFIIAGKVSFE